MPIVRRIVPLIFKINQILSSTINELLLINKLKTFRKLLVQNPVFREFPIINVGRFREDAVEFFDHYDSFSYWQSTKLKSIGEKKNILDVGNKKSVNAISSINNNVTAIVLNNCDDTLSNVQYVIHDIDNKLPFRDECFDIFTSMCSLNLAGLGRYGDTISATTLTKFLEELKRVMKGSSDLIISLAYGHNCLNYQNTFIFNITTIKEIFSGWSLVDHLIDNDSGNVAITEGLSRYTTNLDLSNYKLGDYRLIFLHFKR